MPIPTAIRMQARTMTIRSPRREAGTASARYRVRVWASRQLMHLLLELRTAVFVIPEHIEAGADRREKNRIAGNRKGCRLPDSIPKTVRFAHRSGALENLAEATARFPDKNGPFDLAAHGFRETRILLTFLSAAGDENDRRRKALQGLNGRIHVGALGVVDIGDIAQDPHDLHNVFKSAKLPQRALDCKHRASCQNGDRRRRQDILKVVDSSKLQVSDPHHFLRGLSEV